MNFHFYHVTLDYFAYLEEQIEVLNVIEVTWHPKCFNFFSWRICFHQAEKKEKNLHMPLLYYPKKKKKKETTERQKMTFSIPNKVPAWSDIIRLPSYYVKSN